MRYLLRTVSLAALSTCATLQWLSVEAYAQQAPALGDVISGCGSVSYSNGTVRPITVDTTGKLCDSGSGGGSVTIGGSLPAGTNNIGGVEVIDSGGTNKLSVNASGQAAVQLPPTAVITAQATIATTTGSYSTGSVVGGLQTITATTGLMMPSEVFDRAKKDCALDFIVFQANPTSSTITDGSAVTIGGTNGADGYSIAGYQQATSYSDFSASSTAQAPAPSGQPIEIKPAVGSTIYVAPIVRVACTWAVTNGLVVNMGFLQQ